MFSALMNPILVNACNIASLKDTVKNKRSEVLGKRSRSLVGIEGVSVQNEKETTSHSIAPFR